MKPIRHHVGALGLLLLAFGPARAAVSEKGEVRQPRNIYELAYAFDHTFNRILTPEELKLVRTKSQLELRQDQPALYARLSQDVKGWTDEWLQHALATGDQIPQRKLEMANEKADRIDKTLKAYFEERNWPYRPMRVVFLPPRLFLDESERGKVTSGMFIPFYPDAFFATVDWVLPIDLTLVHESLHFNANERAYGARFTEGITESASQYLVLKYGIMDAGEVKRGGTYPEERKALERLLEAIVTRTSCTREAALELVLGGYITGRRDALDAIFGAKTWDEVLKLSHTRGDWQAHRIAKVVGE